MSAVLLHDHNLSQVTSHNGHISKNTICDIIVAFILSVTIGSEIILPINVMLLFLQFFLFICAEKLYLTTYIMKLFHHDYMD